MIGKLIAGIVVGTLRLISYIPFIGTPLTKVLIFILDNLFALIGKLPYILGIALAIFLIVYW